MNHIHRLGHHKSWILSILDTEPACCSCLDIFHAAPSSCSDTWPDRQRLWFRVWFWTSILRNILKYETAVGAAARQHPSTWYMIIMTIITKIFWFQWWYRGPWRHRCVIICVLLYFYIILYILHTITFCILTLIKLR